MKVQQAQLWARVKEETRKGKRKWRVGDLLADERCSLRLDFLRTTYRINSHKSHTLKAASAALALHKRPLVSYSTSAISKSAGAQFSNNTRTRVYPRTAPSKVIHNSIIIT